MARIIRTPRIMQKFYVYDPNVPDTFGGLRVYSDKEKDGKEKEGTRHILAVTQQVQYWIDQGIIGEKPVGDISGAHKKLLAQITRGRSEDNDADPGRIPKYNRRMQKGSPTLAGQSMRTQRKKPKKNNGKVTKTKPAAPAAAPLPRT